jgi:UDP-N-acetyl-D-glucosamine dehydrogenase
LYDKLLQRIDKNTALIGVIGLGYVGLPLCLTFASRGLRILGFDIDTKKVDALNSGSSYIGHIPAADIKKSLSDGRAVFTDDFTRLREPDAIIICVPTPLHEDRTPDLSFVINTTKTIAQHLHKGQLVVLESTTYPGTTREVMLPILENSGLKVESDFFLAFSPEREDPGNPKHRTASMPKVVGGIGEKSLRVASALYGKIVPQVVEVSSCEVAEAAKILENVYRAVNIALVNEMKIILDRMGIDIHEVIRAAATKPFGFQPFYPGPGWGGHCIPLDPFYLSWKARVLGFESRFIEDAGWINIRMPHYVVEKLSLALEEKGQTLKGSKILVLGLAYKKNVDDDRESPAYEVIELLLERGAAVSYHDPYIPQYHKPRRHPHLEVPSVPLTADTLRSADAVIIITDHDVLDKDLIAKHSRLIIDTRNFLGGVKLGPGVRLVKA